MRYSNGSLPLTVTFDTNTLSSVAFPETAQRRTKECAEVIRCAIEYGRVKGFFSETLITIEGIVSRERANVLGKTRLVSRATAAGENRIDLTISVRHVRNPLDPRFFERIRAAIGLGMRPLRTATRIGGVHLKAEDYQLYQPAGGVHELVRCMDKVNSLTTEIARRGVGQAIAVHLGVEFSKRDGISTPELWLQGLGRSRDKFERRKVAAAVREWADGDSVAAHYGFGIDLFCSEDFGKSTHGPSILNPDNRQWLKSTFNIEFVTLEELVKKVSK